MQHNTILYNGIQAMHSYIVVTYPLHVWKERV